MNKTPFIYIGAFLILLLIIFGLYYLSSTKTSEEIYLDNITSPPNNITSCDQITDKTNKILCEDSIAYVKALVEGNMEHCNSIKTKETKDQCISKF